MKALYWPGLCVAGLCVGAGVHLLATSAVLGVFGLLIGITLAYLTLEANT